IDPLAAGYDTPPRQTALERELRERFSRLPGVQQVATSVMGLFSGSACATSMGAEGFDKSEGTDDIAYCDQVAPGYFSMLRIPLVLGREFTDQDTASSQRVAIVNEGFVKKFFPNRNPIGRQIWWDDNEHRAKRIEVVGVVKDIRDKGLKEDLVPQHYLSLAQMEKPSDRLSFALRTAGDPSGLTEVVRSEVKAYNSAIPIDSLRTLDRLIDSSINNEIIIAKLSSFFGILALVLASIGLYGVMSYTIAARTRELGVRMALGAQRSMVLRMVLKEAMLLVLLGVLIGIPAALVASRVITSMLYGLKPYDPAAMASVLALLGLIAAVAGFIPARRATKVDPMEALRYE
ncbi:MAG: FtsX-like permease family protein, partial [Povalibacter sp.]